MNLNPDSLTNTAVTIVITLPPHPATTSDRPLLLTLGQPGHCPTSQTGTLADLPDLITTAWQAYAQQRPLATIDDDDDDEPAEFIENSDLDSPPAVKSPHLDLF